MSKKSAKIAAFLESHRGQDLDAHYLAYFDCFNRALYYEAHEVLEVLWLAGRGGPNHGFYKGLIQLAGAFVHLQRNRLRPAAALFQLARANLQKYPGIHEKLDINRALGLIDAWMRQLESGNFAINPLTATNAPKIELQNESHVCTFLLATRNAHKIAEIRAILGPQVQCLSLSDLSSAPEVVEDASTFAGNATKKAVTLAQWLVAQTGDAEQSCPQFVLADDSGLEVDALKGAPGVHSARFAALDTKLTGNSPDADNNAKLLRLLRDVPAEKRTARFRCVLALTPVPSREPQNASPVCAANEAELATELFDGACDGRIAFVASGKGGFGYDPLFIPDGYAISFAELGEDIKNQFSHRARALAKLRARLDSLHRR